MSGRHYIVGVHQASCTLHKHACGRARARAHTHTHTHTLGEFVGGCDIMMEMHESGDLKKMLTDVGATVA